MNFGIQTSAAGGSALSQRSNNKISDAQSGYTFINKLKIPCSITLDGYDELIQQSKHTESPSQYLFVGNEERRETEENIEELQRQFHAIGSRDPMAAKRKQTIKK